jgi:LmbE family N-acetylglucosaminyl deacetylase
MDGWPQNDASGSFWRTPIDEPVARLADLMRTYRPQVVVTYDENGFYGHPDHIQANRITQAAVKESGIPAKLYYTALPRSALAGFRAVLEESGIEGPQEVEENPDFGTPDELITTRIDVSEVTGRKYASLAAHASQSDNIFFLEMGEELFSRLMNAEYFVRAFDTTNAPVPEEDLFAGIR